MANGPNGNKRPDHFVPFYPEEKVAMFVDGSNLYAAAKSLDFDIDYRQLLQWVAERGRLVRASYYTTLVENDDYSPLRPLVDWLDYNGYRMVTKTVKEYTDHSGRKRYRGSVDVDLAVDMVELAASTDHLLLFSGDGDFCRAVAAAQARGARVTVISTIESGTPSISDDLRRQADHFLDLKYLMPHIKRADAPVKKADEDTA
jgi:uncharacterized LabA/DUF88 family protein